ncbi:DUF2127 domain-containing protein [Pseudacidobacterium ailaaui]|jgi:carbon starvation protein CstA|uniref:DUF2127 domain-containing protein n=1 Tax=Pseudacidobacterium ailaaui TaxID=1382359 RepID=UPI00138E3AA4|nr:DUF2127 domain-containing protein [Pseudacidobacterium ailaaui]MCL6463051.1 DUF2127 domain-containing protein [Pseudacidobacterium ailaaui]MDI3253271.1 DUF2127 domain-containing protein [Bacillota bacterium]
MAVIALWLLLLCGIGLFGVITHRFPWMVIIVCALFAAAASGLLQQRRWGWALALSAAFLSLCYGTYMVFRFHQAQLIVMVVVNLIFFLYLVRPEVLERLR